MEHGAGLVIIRFFDGEPRILGLRVYSSYDLPKGEIEEGEDTFEAALRETEEECGITELDHPWGKDVIKLKNRHKKRRKVVTVYMARTSQDAAIQRNPKTGKYEHHDVKWLTLDEAEQGLHTYLRPAAHWARLKLAGEPDPEEKLRDFIKLMV